MIEQEVCIGSLGQQKIYLHWPDVKDICTYAVSAAYEQTKRENAQLRELLRECKRYIDIWGYTDTRGNLLLPQINQVLGEDK